MALLSYDNRTVGTLTTIVLLGSTIVGLFGLWMVSLRILLYRVQRDD